MTVYVSTGKIPWRTTILVLAVSVYYPLLRQAARVMYKLDWRHTSMIAVKVRKT